MAVELLSMNSDLERKALDAKAGVSQPLSADALQAGATGPFFASSSSNLGAVLVTLVTLC